MQRNTMQWTHCAVSLELPLAQNPPPWHPSSRPAHSLVGLVVLCERHRGAHGPRQHGIVAAAAAGGGAAWGGALAIN